MSNPPVPAPQPEPWLRGPIGGADPLIAPVLAGFTQVREDLALHTVGLSQAQVWKQVGSLPSLGFHLRHIAGSVDRLMTYLMGEQISSEQIAVLKQESVAGASLDELLAALDAALAEAEVKLHTIDPATIHAARGIGRKQLPTSVLGLLVHIAEHTQRHLGQAITTAKLAREI
jgi:uncharacterized damage-inducible protein DinB